MRGTVQVARNRLTLAVLDVCGRLVDFGAYTSVSQFKGLLSSLVGLLGGNDDVCAEGDDVALVPPLSPVCVCVCQCGCVCVWVCLSTITCSPKWRVSVFACVTACVCARE